MKNKTIKCIGLFNIPNSANDIVKKLSGLEPASIDEDPFEFVYGLYLSQDKKLVLFERVAKWNSEQSVVFIQYIEQVLGQSKVNSMLSTYEQMKKTSRYCGLHKNNAELGE
jgi:hypothetical protein